MGDILKGCAFTERLHEDLIENKSELHVSQFADAHEFFVMLDKLKKLLDKIAFYKWGLDDKLPYHRAARELAKARAELMKNYHAIDDTITIYVEKEL